MIHQPALLKKLTAKQLAVVLKTNPRHPPTLSERDQQRGCRQKSGSDYLLDKYLYGNRDSRIPDDFVNELLLSWANHFSVLNSFSEELALDLYIAYDKRCGTRLAIKYAVSLGYIANLKTCQKAFPNDVQWNHYADAGVVATREHPEYPNIALYCYEKILKWAFPDSLSKEEIDRSRTYARDAIEKIVHHLLVKMHQENDLDTFVRCFNTLGRELTEAETLQLQARLRETFVQDNQYVQSNENLLLMLAFLNKKEQRLIMDNYAKRGDEYRLKLCAALFDLPVTAEHHKLLYRHDLRLYRSKPDRKTKYPSFIDRAAVHLRDLVALSPKHQPLLTQTLVLARKIWLEVEVLTNASLAGDELGQPLTLQELVAYVRSHALDTYEMRQSENKDTEKQLMFALEKLENMHELVLASTLPVEERAELLTQMRMLALEKKYLRLASDIGDEIGNPLTLDELETFVNDNHGSYYGDFLHTQNEFAITKMISLIGPAPDPAPITSITQLIA